jgi:hypothetical protein
MSRKRSIGALHFVIGAIALVVGVGVGGLGPRAEVRALRAQLEEAGECEDNGRMGSEIANVFRGQPWAGDSEPTKRVTRFRPTERPPDAGPAPEDVPDGEQDDGIRIQIGSDGSDVDGEMSPEDVQQNLELAREAMTLRYEQARAALIEDANPSDEQLAQIDDSMARMNDELIGLANDLVEQMNLNEEPSRRDTMLYAAETLDVVLSAEEDLRGILDAEQVANLQEESLDPLSYVDPAIIDVLQRLDSPPGGFGQ